jgi:hypothetical protein
MQTSKHLSRDELSAYVLGRLPWEHVADVESHLDACDECERQVASLDRSSDRFVGMLRGLPVGVGLGQVPKSVAGLEIIEELAHGGLGVVYLAHHPGLGRHQAVKLLLPDHRGNVDLVARFQREKRAIAQLKDKQHIVEIFDAGCDPAQGSYLVDGVSRRCLSESAVVPVWSVAGGPGLRSHKGHATSACPTLNRADLSTDFFLRSTT